MKKLNKYDFILKMFCSSDNLRPKLQQPGLNEDIVNATNGHVVVRFDKNLAGNDYSLNTDFPDVKRIFNEIKLDKQSVFKTDDLLEAVYSCEHHLEYDREDCERCSAQGCRTCPCCDNEVDCKECDGYGTTKVEKPFAKIKLIGKDVVLAGKTINGQYLYMVLQVAYLLKQDEIIVCYNETDLKLIFKAADVEILVMAIYPGKE